MKNFKDITIKMDAIKYLNTIDSKTLLIYSPTSIKDVNIKNNNIHMISTHEISKDICIINEMIKKLNFENVISFGGGTAIDIGKYIASKKRLKFICIPTMLSTNSYSTDKAVLISDGKKVTLKSNLADMIIFDEEILKIAKIKNLYGIADILSTHTALYDWKISEKYNNEYIVRYIYDMANNLLRDIIDFIYTNDLEDISNNIDKLYEFIGFSGYITNLHTSGRPRSGSEHIFAKEMEHVTEVPHGISVSLGILIMSIIQENYSEEICNCIKKIKVLDKYIMPKEEIINILINTRPRKDRYSIIDKCIIDNKKAIEIINRFSLMTKIRVFI